MATNLFVNYRPLRIGFCVRENSIEDVVRAAELNTLLWGGIYNPIIPVGSDIKFSSKLVEVFKLDLLYPVSNSAEIKKFIDGYNGLKWPGYDHQFLFNEENKKFKMAILDVSNIINYYWENEFKNSKGSNCLLPIWSQKDKLSPVFTLEFGNYPKDPKLSFDHRIGYLKGLRAKKYRIIKNSEVKQDIYDRMLPISLTEDRLILSSDGWRRESNGIYLGKPNDFMDLLNFWNLRASGVDIHFLPIDDIDRVKSFISKHIVSVSKKDEAQRIPYGVGFWYRNMSDDDAKKISDQLLETGRTRTFSQVSEISWNGLNLKPPKLEFERKNLLASVDKPFGKPSIYLQLPEKPAKEFRDNSDQKLVVEIDPLGEYEYEGYTLELPFLSDLNEWYSRIISFNPHLLRVNKESVGIICDLHDSTLTLRPIENQKIVEQIFERSKIGVKASKPGLIARRLIERMGDIDDCRVFKIRGVRKLIESLSPSESITHSNALLKIKDVDPSGKSSFDNHKSLYIKQRNTKDLTLKDVFEYLLEKNVFTIGLTPKCPNCELDFWLSLKEANDHIKCEYCGHEFLLSPQLTSRGDFRFRRSGLFGRSDNQEGAIPVLLTLLQLLRRSGMNKIMYSTALKLDSKELGINCETDFVVVGRDNFENKVTMIIGECKTRDQISSEDILNFQKVKEILEKDGIKVYLLFSKTSQFTTEELDRFRPLATKYNYPILLSSTELEPYEMYEYYQDNGIKIPNPYAHRFEEMAENSFDIYLKSGMKNALILHEAGGSPSSSWIPWLENQLQNKGYLVWVPGLPLSSKPNAKNYRNYILSNSHFNLNENSLVVGHFSGAVAMLNILQNLSDGVVIDTCVLICPFKDNMNNPDLDGLFEEPFDFKEIKKHSKNFIVIHSNNDPKCSLDNGSFIAKKLGAKLIIVKGKNHLGGSRHKQLLIILKALGLDK